MREEKAPRHLDILLSASRNCWTVHVLVGVDDERLPIPRAATHAFSTVSDRPTPMTNVGQLRHPLTPAAAMALMWLREDQCRALRRIAVGRGTSMTTWSKGVRPQAGVIDRALERHAGPACC
jgi:hypothetical protein